MKFICDKSFPKSQRLYHRPECPKCNDIPQEYRHEYTWSQVKRMGLPMCPYCNKLAGYIRCNQKDFERFKSQGIKYYIDETTQTIYIRTSQGFWKAFLCENNQYKLKHRNQFHPNMSWNQLKYGDFHTQIDCKVTGNLSAIIEYIIAHDRAKDIIHTKGYQYLPKSSKKQKRYYEAAKKRAKDEEFRRVWQLLESKELVKHG